MKKVTLTVPWGQFDPIVKNVLRYHNKNTVYYNVCFLQIIFYNTGLYSNIDKQTRLCLRNFRIYRSRNRVEGFAISQNICLDAVFTRFIWYVLLETTLSSESMERFINCATSSWSVVCFTSSDKFVAYVANRCQLVIGSSLGSRG